MLREGKAERGRWWPRRVRIALGVEYERGRAERAVCRTGAAERGLAERGHVSKGTAMGRARQMKKGTAIFDLHRSVRV